MKKLLFLSLFTFSLDLLANALPLSLEDLNDIRQVKSAHISPNGKHIAFAIDVPDDSFDGNDVSHLSEIYLVSRKGVIKPIITGGAPLGFITWGKDSQSIYYLSKKETDSTVSLYQFSLDANTTQKRFSFQTDLLGYELHSDNHTLLFWAEREKTAQQKRLVSAGFHAKVYEKNFPLHALYVVDLNQQEPRVKRHYSSTHVLQAAWLTQSQNIALKHASSPNTDDVVMRAKLSIVNQAGELTKTLSPGGKMGKFSVSPDGQRIAYIGNNDERDPAEGRLWILPIETFKPWQLITDFKGHIEQIDWLRDDTVAFIAQIGLNTVLASKGIENLSGRFRTLLKNAGTLTALDVDNRGRNIAVLSPTAKHPKELFWYTRNSTVRITDSNPWLKKRRLAKQKAIEYVSRDGTKVQALVIPPINDIFENPPGLIFVHGGPEAHASNGWNNRYANPISAAAEKGFVSIIPNYRGSTGRGIEFSKLGQNDYAGAEFDDLLDARQWLIDNYNVDPNRVGITGTSYGGYAASWAATKHHALFSASVSGMGIANQISKYGVTDIPTEMIQLHSIIYPWDAWGKYLDRSPIYHTQGSTTPLLLLHGEQDKRVPASQSVELYRYFKMRAKAPTRLVLYPEEGHGFIKATAKLDYSMRLMRWMEHFLIHQHTQMPDYYLRIEIPESEEPP